VAGERRLRQAQATRGKRSTTSDGDIEVVAKNPNGDGSVFYEPRFDKDGTEKGIW